MAAIFRSDSDFCGQNSWNRSPLLHQEDPVLFYSPNYEYSLLDKFLPGCPSWSNFMNETNSELEESCLYYNDHYMQDVPMLEESHIISCEEPTISSSSDEIGFPDVEDNGEEEDLKEECVTPEPRKVAFSPPCKKTIRKRRGRPPVSHSDSKMAIYAKQYRETKKQETRSLQIKVAELEKQISDLKESNRVLQCKLNIKEKEIGELRSQNVEEQVSCLLNVISKKKNINY